MISPYNLTSVKNHEQSLIAASSYSGIHTETEASPPSARRFNGKAGKQNADNIASTKEQKKAGEECFIISSCDSTSLCDDVRWTDGRYVRPLVLTQRVLKLYMGTFIDM